MKKLLIFTIPIVLVAEVLILNTILQMISAPNDIEVFVSIVLICVTAFLNYLYILFILQTFKNTEK